MGGDRTAAWPDACPPSPHSGVPGALILPRMGRCSTEEFWETPAKSPTGPGVSGKRRAPKARGRRDPPSGQRGAAHWARARGVRGPSPSSGGPPQPRRERRQLGGRPPSVGSEEKLVLGLGGPSGARTSAATRNRGGAPSSSGVVSQNASSTQSHNVTGAGSRGIASHAEGRGPRAGWEGLGRASADTWGSGAPALTASGCAPSTEPPPRNPRDRARGPPTDGGQEQTGSSKRVWEKPARPADPARPSEDVRPRRHPGSSAGRLGRLAAVRRAPAR